MTLSAGEAGKERLLYNFYVFMCDSSNSVVQVAVFQNNPY